MMDTTEIITKLIAGSISPVEAKDLIEARIAEAVKAERGLLKKALELIKVWHNGEAVMKLGEEQAEYMWDLYYNHAPEMKEIRQALSTK